MSEETDFQYGAKEGLPPGTLVYIGSDRGNASPHLSWIAYGENHPLKLTEGANIHEVSMPEEDGCFWYDYAGLHCTDAVRDLCNVFGIHPLVQEDIVNCNQRPKFEDYGTYSFVTLKHIRWPGGNHSVHYQHISMVIGKNWIITFRESGKPDPFARIRERLKDGGGRLHLSGIDYLCYACLDILVDGYYTVLEKVDDALDEINEHQADYIATLSEKKKSDQWIKRGVPTAPAVNTDTEELTRLLTIFRLKREIHAFRRAVFPARDVINHFCTADGRITQAVVPYMRDVLDHISHVIEDADILREMTGGVGEMALGMISFRMNAIMKILAIVSSIFIPLTFIAGVYGMNFEYMPELKSPYGYYMIWGFMIAIVAMVLWFFHRKRWL